MYATHATRASYQAGCRCLKCRQANALYTAGRRAHPQPRVLAGPVRSHLQALAQLGIGYRRAAQLAQLSAREIQRIRNGTVQTVRATVAARVLAIVASLAHGAAVAGTKTWRTVDSLLREGFSRRQLARQLGFLSPQLHWNHKTVRVRSALRMTALYRRLATV